MFSAALRLSILALVCLCSDSEAAALLRPNSARSASDYSAAYSIVHAINGSGLPSSFGPANSHADYAANNHWTTQAGALAASNAKATLVFTSPVVLDAFHLWNHRSHGATADSRYGVSQFDLIFKDRRGSTLFSLLNQSAALGIATAQTYSFPSVSGVGQVEFIIKANGGSTFAGAAEFAFNGEILPAPPGIIQPTSATAASEFGAGYDIGNVIDGSGLPVGFGPDSLHADYASNNHWTTASGAWGQGSAKATFYFDWPVVLSAFHLWNHRSNIIAADPNYAVTQFDLVFKDASGAIVQTLLDQTASGAFASAQSYAVAAGAPVAQVEFLVDSNQGSPYTGLAEVAFTGYLARLLQIHIDGPNIKLTWPANASDYLLEASTQLPATTWTQPDGPIEIVGVRKTMILPRTPAEQYFRLRQLP